MFWKKEAPKFEVRPLYSIREELELIREFCWQPKLEAGKIYTEEEIDVVEKRLGFQLPLPLRELYLVLGDYMCDKKDDWFCSPEELHWNGRYLLVTRKSMMQPENLLFLCPWNCGKIRGKGYVNLYITERKWRGWICHTMI